MDRIRRAGCLYRPDHTRGINPSLPAEKHPRAKPARKAILALLALLAIAFMGTVVKRWVRSS